MKQHASKAVLALIASLLVVSQITGLALAIGVVSQFDTNSEFDSATTLDDMLVDSDTVQYDNRTYGQNGALTSEYTTTGTFSETKGVTIQPNEELTGFTVVLAKQSEAGTVELRDSSGSIIESASVVNGVATFSSTINSSQYYRLVTGGTSFVHAYNSSPNTPYTGTSVDIETGSGTASNETTIWDIRAVYEQGDTLASIADKDGQYVSGNHTVDNPSEVAVNLTLDNTSVTVAVERWTGSSWVVSNQSTFTTTGNHSILVADTGDKWRTDVQVTASDVESTAIINDETYLFDGASPELSNVSPADGYYTNGTTTLSADINDTDFATQQGDSVDVAFVINGSTIGTDTLTANGSASTSWTPSTAGSHTYEVRATDDYGQTTTVSRTVNVPSKLYIRNESNPDELLTSINGTAEVTFYGSDTIERRPITNGTVDMTDLPADETFVALIEAEGYYNRRVVIKSLLEQQSVYLLNQSGPPTVQVRFTLEDTTGSYQAENTQIIVERGLNQSGTTEWRTIVGDTFGVKGVSADLEKDVRYRLRIKNSQTGATASIGSYTAIQSETVTLSPGSATIDIKDSEKDYGWSLTENETGQYILFEYADSANNTSSLKLTIHERFNKSNVLVDNVTFTNANEVVHQEPLTANQSNKTWMAEIYVDRGDGYMVFREPVTGPAGDIIPGELDDTWRNAIGVFITLISGMAFSQLNGPTGALATALIAGILWQIGLLSLVSIGPAIALAIGVTAIMQYRSGGGV